MLLGFSTPFPIQERTIPVLLAGNDVIGQAHTGTGKTAAYALPMLQLITAKNKVYKELLWHQLGSSHYR